MLLAFHWNFLFLLIGLIKADYAMQQAMKAFAELHSVKCQILLFTYSNEFYDQRVLLDFYKAVIKNNYIPTVLENIISENQNKTVSARKQCSKPLRSFIMGNVSYVAKYMIAEKIREDIRKDVWLLFVANDFDQELIISKIELSIGSEVYIARRTNNGYKFSETYQPGKNNPIRIIHYGDWNADTGLRATQLTILERRRNFGGAVLRSARFESAHYNNIQDRKHVQLLQLLSKVLEKELNYTIEDVIVPNNSSEFRLDENPQNIIIKMLARNEADISMVGLVLEPESLSIIDYSGPVVQTHFRVYMRQRIDEFELGLNFFQPLPLRAWYNIVLMVVGLSVIIQFMHYIARKGGLIRTQLNFSDLCMTVYQMLCVQGGTLQQGLGSISLMFLFFNLWAFLMRSIYSAALASSLAIDHDIPPFYSLEGLLQNGQYEFSVRQKSPPYTLYYKSNNSFIKKLNKAAMTQNISKLPTSYLEGLQRICSEKKYAFMVNRLRVLELESEIPCKLRFLPYEMYTVSTAYAMSKHNEYMPFINRWLHVLNEVGVIRKLKNDIFESRSPTFDNSQSFRNLKFEDMIFLQLLVILGGALSISILFAETVYSRVKRNRRVSYR